MPGSVAAAELGAPAQERGHWIILLVDQKVGPARHEVADGEQPGTGAACDTADTECFGTAHRSAATIKASSGRRKEHPVAASQHVSSRRPSRWRGGRVMKFISPIVTARPKARMNRSSVSDAVEEDGVRTKKRVAD